jgi:hypothetical protein
MGQPPSSLGAVQARDTVVYVVVTLVGGDGSLGA